MSIFKGDHDSDIVKVLGIGYLNLEGKEIIQTDEEGFCVYLDFELSRAMPELIFYNSIIHDRRGQEGVKLLFHESIDYEQRWQNVEPGRYRLTCKYPITHLAPGEYSAIVAVRRAKTIETLAKIYSHNPIVIGLGTPLRKDGESPGLIKADATFEVVSRD